MSDQDMINAIISSIQNQANLMLLLQTAIANNLRKQMTADLQNICTVLGIDTSQVGGL